VTDTTMNAAIIDAFGPPEVLQVATVPRPEAGEGEVLIRVHGAGINPVDCKTRAGGGVAGRLSGFPLILGWDVSGIVEALGPGAGGVEVGDEVYGLVRFPQAGAAYAQYVTAPDDHVALKPASLSHREAAALPLTGLTAWQALFDVAKVRAGQRVLVHGAAGGVGHLVVQLAHWSGAVVIGTCSARNAEFARAAGCDEVIDYEAAPFEEQVDAVDAVIDCVGGDLARRSLDVVRRGGVLVTLPTRVEYNGDASSRGIEAAWMLVHPDRAQLDKLSALADEGVLRPHIEQSFALDDIADAHARSETGHVRGKLVIDVA
jgi:NADPH:quinone reductase-like Zn-dependent oxidoreductase